MTDALGAETGPCWAWWKAASKQHGHHRCLLPAGHPGPCGCCCGAVSEAVTHVTPKRATCRHCGGDIIPCTVPSCFAGWKHVAFLHYGPVGPHYCGGRSVNSVAEPAGPGACP